MKVVKIIPYLLMIAAGGFAIPTVKSLIAGEPLHDAYATVSVSLLLLALLLFSFSPKSGGDSGPAKS